jgi:hypothetical protein
MLNAHPRIAIPPENRFVGRLYFGRHRYGAAGSERAARRMAHAVTVKGAGSSYLGTNRAKLVAAFEKSRPTSVAAALDELFSSYAASQGKSRWGDKRPAYYALMDQLDAMFPQAAFVHLVRDGRGCVASLKRPPFGYSSSRAIATWLNSMHAGRRAVRRLGAERVLELRYEDLIGQTEATLRRLCDFIGEDFHPDMLQPERAVASHVPAHFHQYEQIAAGVNARPLRSWESQLDAGEIACLELLGGRYLRLFGYETTKRGALPVALLLDSGFRHVVFRIMLPVSGRLDRMQDRTGLTGRLARRLWRRLQLRRLLFR